MWGFKKKGGGGGGWVVYKNEKCKHYPLHRVLGTNQNNADHN